MLGRRLAVAGFDAVDPVSQGGDVGMRRVDGVFQGVDGVGGHGFPFDSLCCALVGDGGVGVGRESDYRDFVELGAGDGDVDAAVVAFLDVQAVFGGPESDAHPRQYSVGDELAGFVAERGVGDDGVDDEAAVFVAHLSDPADRSVVVPEKQRPLFDRSDGAGADFLSDAGDELGDGVVRYGSGGDRPSVSLGRGRCRRRYLGRPGQSPGRMHDHRQALPRVRYHRCRLLSLLFLVLSLAG